jgi:hypothetical protein
MAKISKNGVKVIDIGVSNQPAMAGVMAIAA